MSTEQQPKYQQELRDMRPDELSDEDLKRIAHAAREANFDAETRAIVRKLHALPVDEMKIALDFRAPFPDRLAKLTELRRRKAAKRASGKVAEIARNEPKHFEQYVNDGDVIRARGMGILLEPR
ncbi:MAG: hypothetical protein WBV28_00270 [Terracidiphilus sp.]